MVDEHEKLPSGKLALLPCPMCGEQPIFFVDAPAEEDDHEDCGHIGCQNENCITTWAPQPLCDLVDKWNTRAETAIERKYLALEPLLRELCEARGKSTQGEWEAILNSDPRGVPVVMYRGLICTTEHGVKYQAVVAKNGYVASSEWNANTDFIATAANITARIGEVVDGK